MINGDQNMNLQTKTNAQLLDKSQFLEEKFVCIEQKVTMQVKNDFLVQKKIINPYIPFQPGRQWQAPVSPSQLSELSQLHFCLQPNPYVMF